MLELWNFIEIASHLKEEFNCLFDGTDVFNTKAENLVKMVNEKSPYDENDPEVGWMYSFPELGLNFWRSRIFKEEDKLEDWFIELSQEDQKEECRFLYFETVSIFLIKIF
nr:hypothetical protein [Paenibacillus polymyxa]